ncbi:MAG TPA: sulfite exporter TauE/SafE family protein, partial [Chloroflexota bacterium]|nr:sulfite exporter TauE/SafE family protein [Chloroflexota bacterium]
WPFLVGSIPLAIVGGMMPLPRSIYNPLVGIVLLASAASLISSRKILANSAAALAGNVASVGSLPAALPLWSAAVLIGGLSGAELGSRWLPTGALIRILVLLQIAGGLKLLVWP